MHKKPIAAVLAPFVLLASSMVVAEEANSVNFLGGATVAYKNISFEIPAGGVSFSPDLMMFNTSGTLSYGSFFMTVNYDQTIKDDVQYMSGERETNLIIMNREDMDASIGYYLGKGFSMYAGYKDGTLTADITGSYDAVSGNCAAPPCAITPFQVEFRDKGPFVGFSYTAALENSSVIFNLAYADMDGTANFGNNGGSKTSGDTTGFSYSLAWSIPVTDNTTFTPKLNIIRYDFEDVEMGTRSGDGNAQDLSFKQEFDVISFTLAHYF